MTRIEIEGKELLVKKAVKHGGGAMVYVPKAWIGEYVGLVRGVKPPGDDDGKEG